MRRIFVVLLLFFITVGAAWSQFYTNLSQDQRKELAEAYYLAGQQYKRVNKTEKGNEFISMAYRIYPGLHSETIEPAELPRTGGPVIVGEWHPKYNPIPPGVTPENIIKYQFSRFLRGFFTEDKETMLAAVDKRLYLPGLADGMPKPELDARLQYFFLNEEVDEVPPSTICDLASITVKQTNRHVWQASVTLTENPSVDILSELPGNNRTLTFFFRLVGQSWLIFAFGELPPQVDRIVSPEETIRDTMVACLQQFADENAEGASTFFTDPFLNTLVDEDVTQDELVATFQGYFEDYDFSSLQNQRVVFDINRSPEMKHPGGATYKVTMEFSGSADSDFPFWETLNGYYLVFDERENAWRIFAIF